MSNYVFRSGKHFVYTIRNNSCNIFRVVVIGKCHFNIFQIPDHVYFVFPGIDFYFFISSFNISFKVTVVLVGYLVILAYNPGFV